MLPQAMARHRPVGLVPLTMHASERWFVSHLWPYGPCRAIDIGGWETMMPNDGLDQG